MKKLLWFSIIDDTSSFSRISFEILKELIKDYKIILLTYKSNKKENSSYLENLGAKIVNIGDNCKNITFDEYVYSWKQNRKDKITLECQMKYTFIQMAEIILEDKPDYTIICNGIYECDFFIDTYKKAKQECTDSSILDTKLIIWAPIDVLPEYNTIKNLDACDKIITMTPFMRDIIKEKLKLKNVFSIGHGSYNINDTENISRNDLIKLILPFKDKLWVGKNIMEDDIIFLNANNCVPRKRHDLTIKIFNKVCDHFKKNNIVIYNKLKLWLHTDMSKLMTEYKDIISNSKYKDKIILSNNNITNYELQIIYRLCDYGIQTSTGEGWSLTNCEHALYNKIQIVPDFLATGYHFKNNRGILIPVKLDKDKNNDTIGIIDINIAIKSIISLLNNEITCEFVDYFKQYTWDTIVNEFKTILNI